MWRRGIIALGNIGIFLFFLGMFFGSGASALMYELVWIRSLALLFGVTLHAISAVLASFMAGLALGSAAGGWLTDRVRWPLLYYAALEIAIGLTAVMSLTVFSEITPWYVNLHEQSDGSGEYLAAIRFAAACGVMLLPTTLMGATLPFMVRASLVHLSKVGENISLLYAVNTAGAATGALLAGFVLIGAYGLQTTVYIGGAINTGIGALALLLAVMAPRATALARGRTDGPAVRESPAEPPAAAQPPLLRRIIALLRYGARRRPPRGERWYAPYAVLLGIGVSGFCALAYEVVWFRILDLFLNGTTYAFTVMLVTFLAGLAAGSALTRPAIGWSWNWTAVLGLLELLIAWVSLSALDALPWLPLVRDALVAIPSLTPLLERPVFVMGAVTALALLPLAVLLGMTFPVAARALARTPGREGAHIGALSASNTLGAIAGSLAGGLWLIPTLGTQNTLVLLALVNFGIALLLLWAAFDRHLWLRLALPVFAAWLVAQAGGPRADIYPTLYGRLFKDTQYIWHEEGVENTVSVQRHKDGYLMLFLNSREQAFDQIGVVQFHELIGQLGMVLHPDPKDVLVIGLGAGATPGAISRFGDARIDVVELSPTVVRAADLYFRHINNDLLNRSNVTTILDDGRNHLLLTRKKYDLVTADIIQAHHAGSGNLYSREYFTLVRQALKPGGLMVQWINPGQELTYPFIVRTFAEVFPGASVWFSGQILVGGVEPHTVEAISRGVEARASDPQVQAALVPELGLDTPEVYYYQGPIEQLLETLPPAPILTDDRPLTEYFRSIGTQ